MSGRDGRSVRAPAVLIRRSLCVPRWRALILSPLPRRPATQILENPANDFSIIDQRDDVHRRAALGTFQRIDLIDLVDLSRPRRSGARCNQLPILGCLHRHRRRSGACPLAPAAGRIPTDITHKVFKPIRNMAAKQFEPLRTGHQLEIALQPFERKVAVEYPIGHRRRRHD